MVVNPEGTLVHLRRQAPTLRLVLLITLTLVGFAANSIICRIALSGGLIDPATFTALRLLSGALVLYPLSVFAREHQPKRLFRETLGSASALFAYAIAFSLAYVSLSAGVGALILFGSVQVTMLVAAFLHGERLGASQWTGVIAAFGGLVYLTSPGLTAPNPWGALLMCGAGIAWGMYSVLGRHVAAPVATTAANFLWAAPLAVLAGVVSWQGVHWELSGVLLAVLSGSVASAAVYVVWYKALRQISTTQGSIVQLAVPVIAAFGGVVLLSEAISLRQVVASVVILGGVLIAVRGRRGSR